MNDSILEAFLTRQYEEGMALARESDLFDLIALDGPVPQHYLARFYCKGLVGKRDEDVREANLFEVGIWLPDNYLRVADTYKTLTLLNPPDVWHPNVNWPYICLGTLTAGYRLVDIIYSLFELFTYSPFKVTMEEDNALNKPCCKWARKHTEMFPLDRRPLKRRKLTCTIEHTTQGGAE